jgi:hypothetical protein
MVGQPSRRKSSSLLTAVVATLGASKEHIEFLITPLAVRLAGTWRRRSWRAYEWHPPSRALAAHDPCLVVWWLFTAIYALSNRPMIVVRSRM